jgi:hypothetical protein
LTAKKGQLKPVLITVFRTQIARVIPPLGAIARVGAVVFGKFEVARTCYLDIGALGTSIEKLVYIEIKS